MEYQPLDTLRATSQAWSYRPRAGPRRRRLARQCPRPPAGAPVVTQDRGARRQPRKSASQCTSQIDV